MSSFCRKLVRKKYVDPSSITDTKLSRCLTTLDLTALGIGSTLGAGIYVVAGQVAKDTAGPAVILSFLIAALASVLAGLCYAEFGARVPKTGSAYVYSYVTVGEFMAFVIGWNLILEYVIGTASVARAWSSYFDSLIHKSIQTFFRDNMPMSIGGLSPYPDFFAFGITLLLTCILTLGVKESSRFNNIFTGVNLLVVLYVVICGFIKADLSNWSLPKPPLNSTTDKAGDGGFLPFGFSGVMSGAATCFYAFVGFDCIATTGEEVKNPQKAIPISIVLSLFGCFLAYFGVSAAITLMSPYYLLDHDAPLPEVFSKVGWDVARYIIAVGAVCGLSTSLLGAMFPLPRVIYAMASDGLLFQFLGTVSERFKTPVAGTLLSGLFAGFMAMMFDLKELVDMMSIGTLLAYTLVAVSVLLLRYRVNSFNQYRADDRDSLILNDTSSVGYLQQMFNHKLCTPTHLSETVSFWNITIICVLIIAESLILIFLEDFISSGVWWSIALVSVVGLLIFILVYSTWLQPQNQDLVNFKVPLLPILPVISVFVNVYLMLKLSSATWIRFGVWMFLGFLIYFSYSLPHSVESQHDEHIPLSPRSDQDESSDDNIFSEDEESDHVLWNRK